MQQDQDSTVKPSALTRAAMMFAAYVATAGLVVVIGSSKSGEGPSLNGPTEWLWGLFVLFPLGLGRFFSPNLMFLGYFAYLALTIQVVVRSTKVFVSLFLIYVMLLGLNVVGCARKVHL